VALRLAHDDLEAFQIRSFLKSAQPDLVVFSFGGFAEQLGWCKSCSALGLPFVIVSQAAMESLWPSDEQVELMAEIYHRALKIFFVSQGNRKLVETMLAQALANAEVISNPFDAEYHTVCPYPAVGATFNLACVARLDPFAKGQDVLLKVLALDKWQARNVNVSFFGRGQNPKSLLMLAERLGIQNAEFCGYVNGTSSIWKNHHLLILPSRYEGLPISLVEAMLSGRAAVVTDVGGNTEVIDDNQTGFVAKAPTVELFDEAMERAWARRMDWAQMGSEAARRIRALVPEDPIDAFTKHLLGLLRTHKNG